MIISRLAHVTEPIDDTHRRRLRGDRVLRRREQFGISQETLAWDAGYKRGGSIWQIEHDAPDANPPARKLEAIADRLGVSIGWLFGEGPDDLYDNPEGFPVPGTEMVLTDENVPGITQLPAGMVEFVRNVVAEMREKDRAVEEKSSADRAEVNSGDNASAGATTA